MAECQAKGEPYAFVIVRFDGIHKISDVVRAAAPAGPPGILIYGAERRIERELPPRGYCFHEGSLGFRCVLPGVGEEAAVEEFCTRIRDVCAQPFPSHRTLSSPRRRAVSVTASVGGAVSAGDPAEADTRARLAGSRARERGPGGVVVIARDEEVDDATGLPKLAAHLVRRLEDLLRRGPATLVACEFDDIDSVRAWADQAARPHAWTAALQALREALGSGLGGDAEYFCLDGKILCALLPGDQRGPAKAAGEQTCEQMAEALSLRTIYFGHSFDHFAQPGTLAVSCGVAAGQAQSQPQELLDRAISHLVDAHAEGGSRVSVGLL